MQMVHKLKMWIATIPLLSWGRPKNSTLGKEVSDGPSDERCLVLCDKNCTIPIGWLLWGPLLKATKEIQELAAFTTFYEQYDNKYQDLKSDSLSEDKQMGLIPSQVCLLIVNGA